MVVIETVADIWKSTEAIVVLHAGLSDIQNNDASQNLTEKRKSQITSWTARAKGHFFVFCGVPEVGPKDDAMRTKYLFDNKEEHVRQVSVGAANVFRWRSLWGCNRFVLVRKLLKAGKFRCSNGRLKATMLVDTVDGRARSAQTGMLRRQVDLRTRTVPPHDPRAAEASRPAMA
ncbi:hypothetical protein HPB51_001456 [Rhipicephalus microplus]|uniref:Uncharacterized protein n=1 Tax=Rhipicephalus microplus TaxID=6941 RepID=A0A9J6DZ81_RHIMP|nr:hypothetical protein HPB51_001456 [Rhipicephalus microplus]